MSHVTSSKAVILDLDCLRETVRRFFPKLKFMEDKKTFSWWGHWVGDFDADSAAYKNGIAVEDYGKCDHALRLEGVNYEIGIVKKNNGPGWVLAWDFYRSAANGADGHLLSAHIGDGAEKLMARYQQVYLERFAEENGMEVEETKVGDELVLELVSKS